MLTKNKINKTIKQYFDFSFIHERDMFYISVAVILIYLFVWAGFIDFIGIPFSASSIVRITSYNVCYTKLLRK